MTGALNGTDILYIVEMAGTTVYHDNESTPGQLRHLNLQNARIVSGGAKYSQWPNYTTTDDVVGGNMFKHTQLETILLPTTITAIGDNAFMECTALKSMAIPEGVTSIGSYAFNECRTLAEVSLPEGIETLKDATFMNCQSLKEVVIPSSLKSLGGNVFNGSPITSLTLPAGLQSIGYDAFCSSLTELHVQAREVPAAGFRAFHSVNVTGCTLYVPEGTADAYRAADQWSAFTNIVEEAAEVPVVVEKSVVLAEPGTLASLLTDSEMMTLTTLTVGGPLNALDLRVLREMAGSDVNFNVTAGQLTTLDLTDATIVPDEELYYAIHPYSAPSNPIYLTVWSTTMDAVNMPPPLVFEGCHIENITLPKALVTIASAFGGCPLKGTLVIPEGVTHIRDYAFQNCAQLEAVVLPSTLTNVEDADPYYPFALGAHVFEGCSSLKAINLPEGVTRIGDSTFEGCGFEEFTIPATVQSIGSRAFANEVSLTRLVSEAQESPVAQYGAFDGIDFDAVTLVVPDGAESAYRAAEEWCYFYGLDGPEGISSIVDASATSVWYYDLSGRCTKAANGLVIAKGRKSIR